MRLKLGEVTLLLGEGVSVGILFGGKSIGVNAGGGYAYLFYTRCGYEPQGIGGDFYSPCGGRVVKPGDALELEGFRVRVVSGYRRAEQGGGVGYVFYLGGVKVYYAGPTGLVEEIVGLRGEDIDVALLPLGEGAMTPEEASEVVRTVRPRVAVPLRAGPERWLYRFRDLSLVYTQVVVPGRR
ncbi:MBL fold metallo-hydrolase [Thermofilum pendens]|uniref:MBL fold metallo-hydrolase n=1 Tax=Thermofilum pendens (strain DSM 2475 / Hrk 5) TaxID=368408 RepID=A1S0M7_THEPD|nr:MBL fold metallo-hydrolase [Thermofilum pendens]ABL79007.1 hypothetical protein Tpen_1612 [Thermofilum pendens Hrk 5]